MLSIGGAALRADACAARPCEAAGPLARLRVRKCPGRVDAQPRADEPARRPGRFAFAPRAARLLPGRQRQ